jgi:hypothetical protein
MLTIPPPLLSGESGDDWGFLVRVVVVGGCEGCDWLDDGSVDDSSIPPSPSLDMLELKALVRLSVLARVSVQCGLYICLAHLT